jgi:hypothetical protein
VGADLEEGQVDDTITGRVAVCLCSVFLENSGAVKFGIINVELCSFYSAY